MSAEQIKQRRDRQANKRREERFWREIVTPEGATIRLRLADVTERGAALLIDAGIMLLSLILFAMVLGAFNVFNQASQLVFILVFFFLRAFYFTAFELGRKAATPGKRIMRLRVVAREGRQLTANAVFARNAMRELEVFLPFIVLIGGPGDDQFSGLMNLVLVIWLLVFVLLPFTNKDRLRAGDMVAGTWVMRNPRLDLKADISTASSAKDDLFTFSTEQLSAYGEHELLVLEDVLRSGTEEVVQAVATRIRGRIDWEKGPDETDRAFLEAFYTKLRQTLETRMLFGNRKRDKFDSE